MMNTVQNDSDYIPMSKKHLVLEQDPENDSNSENILAPSKKTHAKGSEV